MNSVLNTMPEMMMGQALDEKLSVLPEYDETIRDNSHTIYRANVYQVDDALMAIGNAIYELEDKIYPDLRRDIGVSEPHSLTHSIAEFLTNSVMATKESDEEKHDAISLRWMNRP